jgi:DNA-binding beta-propeller fold protein YncE
VAADPDSDKVFIASPRHNWVYVIDSISDTIVFPPVAVGNGPTGLTVLDTNDASNNKVFVAHQYGANSWRPGAKAFGVNEIASHNTADGGYVGAAPVKVASNRANGHGRIYYSNYFDKLAVLNDTSVPPETRLGWVEQKAYQGAYGIDTSATTERVYLATRDTGELIVFDGNGDRLLQPGYIPTHVKPPQPCTLWSVAVNEATGHVFVPCPQLSKVFVLAENQVTLLSLEALGVLEERDGNWALVVSPAAAPWAAEIDVHFGTDLGQEGIAVVDSANGYVFITNAANNTLVILQDDTDPANIAYRDTVPVGLLSAVPPFSEIVTIPLTP